ncbi:TPA: hypothetical protein R4K21_003212 [Stenotrophomonas maltophilia]|nr:hypothetical protein [Stenotrophomonas maltophilia]
MAEFYNSFATGQANALARQKAVSERNRLAELEDLGPKVIAGDLSATDRAYALDPKRAEAYQGQQDRERQQLVGLARTLTNSASNPEYQAAVYNSAIPYLSRRFGEANIPKVWDASVVMPIAQQILDIDKNTPSLGGTGGTVQSQKIGDDGFIYNTFRDGRMVNTGIKADRQAWFRDQPGFEPTIVNKDGTMQTVGPKDTLTPARPGGVQVDTVGGPVQMNIDGVPTDQQQRMAQTTAMMRQAGYPEEDIDAFVSAQVKSALNAAPPRQSLARPTAAQDAAAVEAAKAGVENANFPNRLDQERQLQDVKTQGAITQAAGTAAAEAEAKDASQRPKRIQQYRQALTAAGNVETSLDKALGLLSPYSTGFVGARSRSIEGSPSYNLASELETIKANLGFDRLQQMRDSSPTGGALGAIAVQELVALQSTIANLDPNQSEEQIRANLDRVKTHYKNWRSAVQQSLADEERAQKAQPTSAPSGRSIARRGRAPDGRTVIQYSDGTIEYGN